MGDYVITLVLELSGENLFDSPEELTVEQKQEIIGYVTSMISVFKPAGDFRLTSFDYEVGRVDG